MPIKESKNIEKAETMVEPSLLFFALEAKSSSTLKPTSVATGELLGPRPEAISCLDPGWFHLLFCYSTAW